MESGDGRGGGNRHRSLRNRGECIL
jgi:hypothetical protein